MYSICRTWCGFGVSFLNTWFHGRVWSGLGYINGIRAVVKFCLTGVSDGIIL